MSNAVTAMEVMKNVKIFQCHNFLIGMVVGLHVTGIPFFSRVCHNTEVRSSGINHLLLNFRRIVIHQRNLEKWRQDQLQDKRPETSNEVSFFFLPATGNK